MKLNTFSKALLAGTLALGLPACEGENADNTTDCRIVKNVSGSPELSSKQDVLNYCAANAAKVLNCFEAIDDDGNIVELDTNCSDPNLSANLDSVFANERPYCIPDGFTQYCDGAVPPPGEDCSIEPAPEAFFQVLDTTAQVTAHCASNPEPDQSNLTCLGLTADGNQIVQMKTNCSDPNLVANVSTVLGQHADNACITTDAPIICQ